MDMHPLNKPPAAGLFMRLMMKIAAVDEETLRHCPRQDWDNVRAVGEILICTWIYQTALFGLISHKLFAAPGEVRPELVAAAMFLSSFIIAIDSYMFIRSGWHLSGIAELKRGGLDVSGGPIARIKPGIFLALRLCLSIGLAQLTAIFVSLLVFAADVHARIEEAYTKANAPLEHQAAGLVDDDIQRMKDSVAAQTTRVTNLWAQIAAMRQNQIDPPQPELQAAERDVAQLLAAKTKADEEQREAEVFASNEAGGIKGDAGNSGVPGRKARYRAAEEQATNARKHAGDAARALDAARAGLDVLRARLNAANDALIRRSQAQLPEVERRLGEEESKLSDMKNQLAALIDGRDNAIRKAVENAPEHVARDDGLLTQLAILKQIAESDPDIKAVVVLIDITSFGFELAAVLAKVTSYVPTCYAALLARDAYLRAVHMADEMRSDLRGDNGATGTPHTRAVMPGGGRGGAQASGSVDPRASAPGAPPLKRPRGRPRKNAAKAIAGDAILQGCVEIKA